MAFEPSLTEHPADSGDFQPWRRHEVLRCSRRQTSPTPWLGPAADRVPMLKTVAEVPSEQQFVFSNLSPGPVQKRLALAIVLSLLVLFFVIAGPLSGIKLREIQAFVALYGAAMLVLDLITAVLLFAQFFILRSAAILVIASGYLFTALLVSAWMPSFPGVFAADGLIGGLQTTSWLYVVWHTGFPLYVLGYALSKDRHERHLIRKGAEGAGVALSVALTVALASASVLVCTVGEPYLPPIVLDRLRYSSNWPYYVAAPIIGACLPALIALWIRRRSILDLWLMVVMYLYLIEIPLAYYPVATRFSIAWYVVRVVALMASAMILIVLLYEIRAVYARLLGAVLAQRREREARLLTGDAVAASIAHELRQPLTAMVASADAALRFLDRSVPDLDRAKRVLRGISSDGTRAGEIIGSIRATFRSDVQNRTSLDVNELIQQALALESADLQKHQILVKADATRQLPRVQGDRIQLEQVLLNLITNAIHAMAATDGPRVLWVRSEVAEGNGVMISVADTGPGIEPKDVDRIFNPLFTTKPDGMGMGLSICRSIIEAHEGRLWVTPNSHEGAVFRFTLRGAAFG
jgi:signal transduction histidine kinase